MNHANKSWVPHFYKKIPYQKTKFAHAYTTQTLNTKSAPEQNLLQIDCNFLQLQKKLQHGKSIIVRNNCNLISYLNLNAYDYMSVKWFIFCWICD